MTSVGEVSYSSKKGATSKDKLKAVKLQEKSQTDGISDESKADQITSKRGKKLKRTVHVESKGLDFEIHYAFHDEPHILLSQVTSSYS